MAKNIFQTVEMSKPRSNNFALPHDKKMSLKMGELVPFLTLETNPGESFTIQTSHLLRFAPLVAPMMHRVNIYTHFFFVPNRILMQNQADWENFISPDLSPDADEAPTLSPYVNIKLEQCTLGTVSDYLGLPVTQTAVDQLTKVTPWLMSAYLNIWNEYYRDQNLQPKVPYKLVPGENISPSTPIDWQVYFEATPIPRAWQHDYFTSCLPWTQKGPEATIPLGDTASIIFENIDNTTQDLYRATDGTLVNDDSQLAVSNSGVLRAPDLTGTDFVNLDISQQHYVDLSTATAAGIIDLRRAFKLQEYLEKAARGGTRYTEYIQRTYGFMPQDSRLQRPEFLGGATTPLTISEVLQTSSTDSEPTPQGNMSGHAISAGQNRTIKYTAPEHGHIIGIMSVMPQTAYQQGLHKMFTRFDKFDYFEPLFEHIGEQPVMTSEIYLDDEPDTVFGYVPRNAEFKYMPSTVHGDFKTSLDFWHWGRIFDNRPQLNQDFIACIPSTRVFAVEESPTHLYAHIFNDVTARRPMSYYANPKL
jgi:hypothetical protein